MRCRKFLSFLIFISALPALGQYGLKVWTVSNGLPQNEIRGVTQTPDGYLWIATMNGLARFDGIRFTIFNRGNTPGIVSNRLTSIEQGSGGDLWITYESGGLLRFDQGHFKTFGTVNGRSNDVINGITADGGGQVWVLSHGLIYGWNAKLEQFDVGPDSNQIEFKRLMWDVSGFYAYDHDHLICFSKGVHTTFSLPVTFRGRSDMRAGLGHDGSAWLQLANGKLIRLPPPGAAPLSQAPTDKRLEYWGKQGLRLEIDAAQAPMRTATFMAAGRRVEIAFRHALTDRQGNLWLATEGNGLCRIRKTLITTLTEKQGLLDSDVYPVLQDDAGAVWMGTWHKGLTRDLDGHMTHFESAPHMPNPLATSLFQDGQGRLWIGTDGGLLIFMNGHFVNAPFPVLPDRAQAIYQTSDGALWFGMRSGGLAKWKDGVLKVWPAADGEAPFDIHVIAETSDGDLWVGGSDGLMQIHNGQTSRWSDRTGLSSNLIWSLYPERDGTLWIGTFDSGLMRLKNGLLTSYSTKNGLFNDGVFQILDDGRGNLWMSCDMGIYRTTKRELLEVANGSRTYISSVSYGEADGISDLESNGGLMPAGTKTRDGKLWFPTQDGVVVVDPIGIKESINTPNVVVEDALIDQISAPMDQEVRVPASNNTLEMQYTAPDFESPDNIRFRYKLEGLDDSWTEAGQKRSVTYTHLPPGRYTFVASAANENGAWSHESAGVPIYIVAPFYRAFWFRCMLVLLLAAIAFGGWSYWLFQLRRRQALQNDFLKQLITSQEGERQRIAGELHDSLGQRLMFINGIAKLALRNRVNHSEATGDQKALEQVSEEALTAMQETRAISYDLRPIYLDRLGLTQAINQLIQQASGLSSISLKAELDDIDDLLPEEQRISLYRIVQEAFSNILKYSEATSAGIRAVRSGQQLDLTIYDNGVGFAVSNNLNKAGRVGMGLRGMSERASLIGASFKVVAAPGSGTVVHIEFSSRSADSA